MVSFDEREKAFEDRAAREAELEFKISARRNFLLGLWAAEQLRLEGDQARNYAQTVVESDLEEAGHNDVIRKIYNDFQAESVELSKEDIEIKLEKFQPVAREQVLNENR